jgi:hypothetical protein
MREKIIATITLTSIFTLFLYYKVSSNDTNIVVSEVSINSESDIVKSDIIDYDVVNDISKKNNEIIVIDDNCSLNKLETDSFSFSEAFKYYRGCLGKDEVFSWNSKSYKTLLASEIIVDSNDDTKNMIVGKKQKIDNNHLDLLNQMIGQNK